MVIFEGEKATELALIKGYWLLNPVV